MSYHPRSRSRARQALGDNVVVDVLTAAKDVALDPCLPSFSKQALELSSLTSGGGGGGGGGAGVGLCSLTGPMNALIWVRRNPWAASAIGFGVIGLLVGVGYSLKR